MSDLSQNLVRLTLNALGDQKYTKIIFKKVRYLSHFGAILIQLHPMPATLYRKDEETFHSQNSTNLDSYEW